MPAGHLIFHQICDTSILLWRGGDIILHIGNIRPSLMEAKSKNYCLLRFRHRLKIPRLCKLIRRQPPHPLQHASQPRCSFVQKLYFFRLITYFNHTSCKRALLAIIFKQRRWTRQGRKTILDERWLKTEYFIRLDEVYCLQTYPHTALLECNVKLNFWITRDGTSMSSNMCTYLYVVRVILCVLFPSA